MKDIHYRMPVIWAPEQGDYWLKEPKEALLQPCPDEWLAAHKVSTKMSDSHYQESDAMRCLFLQVMPRLLKKCQIVPAFLNRSSDENVYHAAATRESFRMTPEYVPEED